MRTIQRDSKLNRHGLPVLDPAFVPRPMDPAEEEREAKLRATEKFYEEKIGQQLVRRSRGVEPPSTFSGGSRLKPLRRF